MSALGAMKMAPVPQPHAYDVNCYIVKPLGWEQIGSALQAQWSMQVPLQGPCLQKVLPLSVAWCCR